MHICFISPCQFNEFTGGVDRVCCQLIRELLKREIQVSSCFLLESVNAGEPGVAHHLFPSHENAAAIENIEYLRNYVLSDKVDIVWLLTCVQGQFECAKQAIKGTSAKLVFTFHSDPTAPLVDLIDARDFSRMNFLLTPRFVSFLQYIRNCVKYPIGCFLDKLRTT